MSGKNGTKIKEGAGNTRPANWPAPPKDKVDRITKGVIVSSTKPKPKS